MTEGLSAKVMVEAEKFSSRRSLKSWLGLTEQPKLTFGKGAKD